MGTFARRTSGSRRRETDEPRLPVGAEAALCSILEMSPIVEPADESLVLDLREDQQAVDPYYDLGAIAENAPLTDHLFTTD